jgi:hypothetical protein
MTARSARSVWLTAAAARAARPVIRPITGNASGYSAPMSAPKPGAWLCPIRCSMFSWAMKPIATTASSRTQEPSHLAR